LHASNFTITVLTRPDSPGTFSSGNRVVQTDYSPSSLRSALAAQDAVICSLGFAALDKQFAIIDASVDVGVKRIILGEFGLAPEQNMTPEFRGLMATKLDVEQYAKEKAAQNEQFSWTAIATGLFLDWVSRTVYVIEDCW
jgi:hypothetical protein